MYEADHVIPLALNMNWLSDDFAAKIAQGFIAMSETEGPYLIHCTEGKDRAGFVSALLECLMGADIHEVIGDYMKTNENYYGLEPGTEKYSAVIAGNIEKILAAAFETEDIYASDLAAYAEQFCVEALRLSRDEVEMLRNRLGI